MDWSRFLTYLLVMAGVTYLIRMLPLAAIGLCRLEEGIKGLWKTKERRR